MFRGVLTVRSSVAQVTMVFHVRCSINCIVHGWFTSRSEARREQGVNSLRRVHDDLQVGAQTFQVSFVEGSTFTHHTTLFPAKRCRALQNIPGSIKPEIHAGVWDIFILCELPFVQKGYRFGRITAYHGGNVEQRCCPVLPRRSRV